MRIQLLTY